jgi:hypothetical protein
VIASQNQSRALLERRVYDPTMDAVVGNVTVNKRPEISRLRLAGTAVVL